MLKVLICDDDPQVLISINTLLLAIKKQYKIELDIDIKKESSFVCKQDKVFDIAILDIEMPGVNGLELTEKLKRTNPDIIVIILTSFSDYLDSAMKIQVFRYLSKPIDKARFTRNFLEALDYYKNISKTIVISHSQDVYTVKTKDILYIENKKHGSIIYTKNNVLYTNKKPMDWYEIINQPNYFVFSHKSYLVNLQNIINFNHTTIVFEKGNNKSMKVQCISQSRYSTFKKSFFNFAGEI